MSSEFVRFGFTSGEISPHLYGRSDLDKYDLGLALAYNWYVDYRGGVTTRPGTEFVDYVQDPDLASRFFKFVFSPDIANTYILLFSNFKVRFIQDGAYVLENAKVITGITQASPGVVTSVAHGYNNGDWLKISDVNGMTGINGKLVEVNNKTLNTYELWSPVGGTINTASLGAYVSGGIAQRVYTVTTPYSSDDLSDLRAKQVRDTMRLTHRNFYPRDLIRNDHTNWVLSETSISNNVQPPTNVVATASDSASSPPGTATAYAVTTVDHDGNESVASDWAFLTDAKNIMFMDASNNVTYQVKWSTVAGAAYYNVYRTTYQIHSAEPVSRSQEMGYIGRAYGGSFYDQNIIPDYTRTPPLNHNPFVNRTIKWINVTAGGAGYSSASVVTVTSATGAGFKGYPVVQLTAATTGPLVAIVVVDGGHDYAPTDTVNVTVGAGATFSIEVSEASGNYPRTSAIFQQRQEYAATLNQPMTIFGSKVGKFGNFDVSSVVRDDDEYEHDIDASVIAPIRHLIPLRAGLLAMSGTGIWVLNGENGAALTPKNPHAELQSYTGASNTEPVQIGTDVMYIESHSFAARLLGYKDINKVYTSDDISYLSSHFFSVENKVEHMAYAPTPQKLVWAQRKDGSLLSFTILYEQKVYAWAQHWTRGQFRDCISVVENGQDSVYVMVDRVINKKAVKMVERLMMDAVEFAEDAWCVDCGLELPATKPVGNLTLAMASGTNVKATSDSAVFSVNDAGKVLRAAGAKAVVVSFASSFEVRVDIIRPANKLIPSTNDPVVSAQGDWTLDNHVRVVGGLDHLEGETVSYLADGNVGTAQVVNGQIGDLPNVTRVVVGLPFICDIKTLPLWQQGQPLEGKKKRTVRCAVNQLHSRGLKAGSTFDKLYEIKDRKNEILGEPIELQDGTKYESIAPDHWKIDAGVCIRQDQPLPATIRALVLDVEVGG